MEPRRRPPGVGSGSGGPAALSTATRISMGLFYKSDPRHTERMSAHPSAVVFSSLSRFLSGVVFLVMLFTALAHSEQVHAACGHTLRDLLLTCVIVCFVCPCAVMCLILACGGAKKCVLMICVLGVLGSIALLVVGPFMTKFAIDAFNAPGCTAAMEIHGVPLLGIVGLVSGIQLTCMGTVLLLVLCCSGLCQWAGSAAAFDAV